MKFVKPDASDHGRNLNTFLVHARNADRQIRLADIRCGWQIGAQHHREQRQGDQALRLE